MNSKIDFEEHRKKRLFPPVDKFTKNEINICFSREGDFLGWVIFMKVSERQHVSDTALSKNIARGTTDPGY